VVEGEAEEEEEEEEEAGGGRCGGGGCGADVCAPSAFARLFADEPSFSSNAKACAREGSFDGKLELQSWGAFCC
jgi:hypothetical protein